jgi:hypothetical protein
MGVDLDNHDFEGILRLCRTEILFGDSHRPPFVTAPKVGETKRGLLTKFQARKKRLDKTILEGVGALLLRLVRTGNVHGSHKGGAETLYEGPQRAIEIVQGELAAD